MIDIKLDFTPLDLAAMGHSVLYCIVLTVQFRYVERGETSGLSLGLIRRVQ
jgi:hypothetical protein